MHENTERYMKENDKSWKGWRDFNRKYKKKILKNLKDVKMSYPENKEKKIEGVVFIQYTPNSELAKAIRERLKSVKKVCHIKLKIVETRVVVKSCPNWDWPPLDHDIQIGQM